jgi:hypothetical protein
MRRLVNSYVFAQMQAGARLGVMRLLMGLMVLATFGLLPIFTLLYFQVTFLPVHDVVTINAIRVALLLDLILLLFAQRYGAVVSFIQRSDPFRLRSGGPWRWKLRKWAFGLMSLFLAVVAAFSWLVATVPQACISPWSEERAYDFDEHPCFSIDVETAGWWPVSIAPPRQGGVGQQTPDRRAFAPTAWLFEGRPDKTTGRAESWFSRNLIVIDNTGLVPESEHEGQETTVALRGRDLRFAVFDRTDLRRADLFGADLRSASARETFLEYAQLEDARTQGADLAQAQLQGAVL